MRRMITFRLWHLLLFCFLLALAACFPAYTRIPQQCVLCRADHTRYDILGMSFSRDFKDAHPFTQWYAAHRPPHAHQWHYSGPGCLWERNFFGLPLTIFRMVRHPIIHISPQDELLYVKHQDETVLAQFFADTASPNRDHQRNATEAVRKAMKDPSLHREP